MESVSELLEIVRRLDQLSQELGTHRSHAGQAQSSSGFGKVVARAHRGPVMEPQPASRGADYDHTSVRDILEAASATKTKLTYKSASKAGPKFSRGGSTRPVNRDGDRRASAYDTDRVNEHRIKPPDAYLSAPQPAGPECAEKGPALSSQAVYKSLAKDGPAFSVGSVQHPHKCKACLWYCSSRCGCRNGANCRHCHQDHSRPTRKQRTRTHTAISKASPQQQRELWQQQQQHSCERGAVQAAGTTQQQSEKPAKTDEIRCAPPGTPLQGEIQRQVEPHNACANSAQLATPPCTDHNVATPPLCNKAPKNTASISARGVRNHGQLDVDAPQIPDRLDRVLVLLEALKAQQLAVQSLRRFGNISVPGVIAENMDDRVQAAQQMVETCLQHGVAF